MKKENHAVTIKALDGEDIRLSYSIYPPMVPLITYDGETSEQTYETEILDAEYEEIVAESHKLDYSVAAASGLLCAALDIFWVGQFSLLNARDIGEEQAKKFVLKVAERKGFKGKDLADAIEFLEKKFPMPGDLAIDDFGGGFQHHLRDFTHHPTLLGLFFSLFAQFTGIICGTDKNGVFFCKKIDPKTGYIGKNIPEKIVFGTIHWFYHLVSDMEGSKKYPGKGTGIPSVILSWAKELSALPIFRKMKYKDKDIELSKWLSKLFNGTFFWDKETNQRIRFDLRTEMGITTQIVKQAVPVVANESIVRGFYFISRLAEEIKNKDITSIKDIEKIEAERIIPANNKDLFRMLTISTGVFSVVDISHAMIMSKIEKGELDIKTVVSRINFPGIGRFAFALKADAKYIYQDIKKKYDSYQQKIYTIHKELYIIPEWDSLSITRDQLNLLYSLEYQMLNEDLALTKGEKAKEKKKHWISVWKDSIETAYAQQGVCIIISEGEFYSVLRREVKTSNNISWLYTVLLEALHFKPYTKLSEEKENSYKGLKFNSDYIHTTFLTKQTIIDKKEVSKIEKTFSKYHNTLLNNNTKLAVGVASTVVVTAATGGFAFFFAPQIATALVGGSFAGIYGAALSSASLAAIGGGALAAGGLGMAGGTAIIAGGGAVVGLVGGGAITASSALLGSSKDMSLNMLTKLLTITKVSVVDKYHRKDVVDQIADNLYLMTARMEHDIEVMKDTLRGAEMDKNGENELKKRIDTSKEGLKYMYRAMKEFDKLQHSSH